MSEAEENAAEQSGGDEEGGAAKKAGLLGGLTKKKLLLFGLPLAILLLGGSAAAILLLSGGEQHEAALNDAAAYRAAETPFYFYEMPELLVNINSGGGRAAYLKLKLNIEVADQALLPVLDETMPRVMDRYQGFLRELRPEDLAGSAGYYRLKLELLRRVNLAIAPAEAQAVNIDQMLIQ